MYSLLQPEENMWNNSQEPPNPKYYMQNTYEPGKKRYKPMTQEGENQPARTYNYALPSQSFGQFSMLPPPIPSMDFLPVAVPQSVSSVGTRAGYNYPKKPRSNKKFGCKECNLWLSSQQTLNVHLTGSKHARKLKELQLADFAKEISSYVCNEGENAFKCRVCNVSTSSILQLKSHVEGEKHKNKVKNISESKADSTEQSPAANRRMVGEITEPGSSGDQMNKSNKFYCNACNVSLNSQTQRDQHTASKKHASKAALQPVKDGAQRKELPNESNSNFAAERKAYNPQVYDAFDPSYG